jgi:hypothetical protein
MFGTISKFAMSHSVSKVKKYPIDDYPPPQQVPCRKGSSFEQSHSTQVTWKAIFMKQTLKSGLELAHRVTYK